MNSIPTSSCDINLCFLNTHSNSYLATRGVKHINGLLLNFLQDRYGLYIIPLTQICILVYSVYAFWFVLWTFKIFSTLFKNLNSGERDGRVGGGVLSAIKFFNQMFGRHHKFSSQIYRHTYTNFEFPHCWFNINYYIKTCMYNISMERQDVSNDKTSKYNQFNLSTQFINTAFYISKLRFSPHFADTPAVPNRK